MNGPEWCCGGTRGQSEAPHGHTAFGHESKPMRGLDLAGRHLGAAPAVGRGKGIRRTVGIHAIRKSSHASWRESSSP